MCGIPTKKTGTEAESTETVLSVEEVHELYVLSKEAFSGLEAWKQAALEAWWVSSCTCKPESLTLPPSSTNKEA
jgi:hypothetical protein